MSIEAAEKQKEEKNSRALDEDELGHLEEDIKDLNHLLRNSTPAVSFSNKEKILKFYSTFIIDL